MAWVCWVRHYLPGPPQSPAVKQGPKGGQGAANHPLCRAYHPLQLGLVLGRCSGEPGDDGGGDDGLDDGRIKIHQHGCWQLEFPELPQEKQPFLGFSREGIDVWPPLQVPRERHPEESGTPKSTINSTDLALSCYFCSKKPPSRSGSCRQLHPPWR